MIIVSVLDAGTRLWSERRDGIANILFILSIDVKDKMGTRETADGEARRSRAIDQPTGGDHEAIGKFVSATPRH